MNHYIIGLETNILTKQEQQWLKEKPPLGIILFARNLEHPEQVKRLLGEAQACAGHDLWIAVDEEGGRVNRMSWPPFTGRKHAAEYGRMTPSAAVQAVYEDALHTGEALKTLGFTHNCAPVLDVFHPSGHAIIGERAYSADVDTVANLGMACMRGLHDAGIEAVGKHFPGHGRADADSHVDVPHVDTDMDTLMREVNGFAELIKNGLRHLMTAHVIYDAKEDNIASFSSFWLREMLQKKFHFSGCVWSDDLCMKGVGSDPLDAAKQAQGAGCDVLLVCEPEGVRRCYEAQKAEAIKIR